MNKKEPIKFKKILTLNDSSDRYIIRFVQLLLECMKETNEKEKLNTKSFVLTLKVSEKNPMADDLILEWESI